MKGCNKRTLSHDTVVRYCALSPRIAASSSDPRFDVKARWRCAGHGEKTPPSPARVRRVQAGGKAPAFVHTSSRHPRGADWLKGGDSGSGSYSILSMRHQSSCKASPVASHAEQAERLGMGAGKGDSSPMLRTRNAPCKPRGLPALPKAKALHGPSSACCEWYRLLALELDMAVVGVAEAVRRPMPSPKARSSTFQVAGLTHATTTRAPRR